ncbi:hypothetical protein BpHYR1_031970 [Brachionus plicatilis]|uniref:Uncharacterized protein n=1 Tax=Brachionus plicatilis TaxID=10195 RepID=A0A3M7SNP0_BRAPC|nr:hypothetical protein BpHYR1_031970 [Brachionus plicatilis]
MLSQAKNAVKILMILMYKWEKAFIQAFLDINGRIDEFNAQKPKKYHNFRISNLNTIDRIIFCTSSDFLLCKVRHKIGFCHL